MHSGENIRLLNNRKIRIAMKKFIIRLLIALVVLVVVVVVAIGLFLDSAIKRGVETFGPKFTKVDIKLALRPALPALRLRLDQGAGGRQPRRV